MYKDSFKNAEELQQFQDCIVNEKRPYILYNEKEKEIVKNNTTINKHDYIHLSGETDFNFKQMHYKRYKKFLEEDILYKNFISLLVLCQKLTFTPVNISLLPQTGNLQTVKKGIGSDRLDTFVWALNAYYSNDVCLLLNHSTQENISRLKSYLSSFDDVYDYCKEIYHIDKQLVDDLINSGKQPIDTAERVVDYINLSFSFWSQKYSYITEQQKNITEQQKNLNINVFKHNEIFKIFKAIPHRDCAKDAQQIFPKECIKRLPEY